jgi:hypothetical protein
VAEVSSIPKVSTFPVGSFSSRRNQRRWASSQIIIDSPMRTVRYLSNGQTITRCDMGHGKE